MVHLFSVARFTQTMSFSMKPRKCSESACAPIKCRIYYARRNLKRIPLRQSAGKSFRVVCGNILGRQRVPRNLISIC